MHSISPCNSLQDAAGAVNSCRLQRPATLWAMLQVWAFQVLNIHTYLSGSLIRATAPRVLAFPICATPMAALRPSLRRVPSFGYVPRRRSGYALPASYIVRLFSAAPRLLSDALRSGRGIIRHEFFDPAMFPRTICPEATYSKRRRTRSSANSLGTSVPSPRLCSLQGRSRFE